MAGYLRDEHLIPFAGGTQVLGFAIDRSSNPDPAPFYRKILDVTSLQATSLGNLGVLQGLSRTAVERWYPDYRRSHNEIPEVLPERRPQFLTGAPTRSVIALVFPVLYPYHLLRFVDLTESTILAEHMAEHVHTLHLNSTGTRSFCTLNTGFACYALDHPASPLYQFALGTSFLRPHQAVWCAGRWCIFHYQPKVWHLAVIDEQSGQLVEQIRLHGKPNTVAAALAAPVVACGLTRNRVQIIDIDRNRSMVVHHDKTPNQFNRMDVAVAPNGLRVLARGTYDQTLFAVACGQNAFVELAPLANFETPCNNQGILITTPGFCLLNDQYLTLVDGTITAQSEALPSILDSAW
jgi:hypothetical protein